MLLINGNKYDIIIILINYLVHPMRRAQITVKKLQRKSEKKEIAEKKQTIRNEDERMLPQRMFLKRKNERSTKYAFEKKKEFLIKN